MIATYSIGNLVYLSTTNEPAVVIAVDEKRDELNVMILDGHGTPYICTYKEAIYCCDLDELYGTINRPPSIRHHDDLNAKFSFTRRADGNTLDVR